MTCHYQNSTVVFSTPSLTGQFVRSTPVEMALSPMMSSPQSVTPTSINLWFIRSNHPSKRFHAYEETLARKAKLDFVMKPCTSSSLLLMLNLSLYIQCYYVPIHMVSKSCPQQTCVMYQPNLVQVSHLYLLVYHLILF